MLDLDYIVEESYKEVSSTPEKMGGYGFVYLRLYVKQKSKKFETFMSDHGYYVSYVPVYKYYLISFPEKYRFRVPDVRERQLYQLVTKKLSENGYNVWCDWRDD